MRRLSLTGLLVISILLFTSVNKLIAQDKSSADVQFELEAYELAINSYLSYLETEPNDEDAMFQLALCYERTNDLIRSARWFEKIFQLDSDQPDAHKIAFGKVLKSLGLFEHANELFASCDETEYQLVAGQLAEGCEMAVELLRQEAAYQVYLYYPSTAQADFSPSIWNDKLVFASFYDKNRKEKDRNMELFHAPSNKLYISERSRKAKTSDLKLLGSEMFPLEGISSCSFSADGSKVLYTRNNFKNCCKQVVGTEKGMSVYLADVDENGQFMNEYALPFNSTDYSAAFACFGEDESSIYFASNQHGDHSDFDIYLSKFNGIEWTEPIDLGPAINTSGNEITPFYKEGTLYFASDLQPGLGGYDLFKSTFHNGVPGSVKNMGKGINSISDDFYLVVSDDQEYFYSSNRLGGKGNYDIYVSVPNAFIQNNVQELAMQENTNNDIPKAVSLASLEEKEDVNIKYSESSMVGYNENVLAPDDLSLEGAVKVSYGEVIKSSSNVYFIQLASLSSSKGNVSQFRNLVEYGNVYRVKKANSYKIRLGYFNGREEARSVLSQVRKRGFNDAFVVEDVLDIKELELLISSFTFSQNEKYQKPEIESEYKVRLAAYSNPLYFDTEKIKDIGVIEQWSKGKWTIFILSGFESLEKAEQARIKAINRGFTGAELVRDDNGVLSRVQKN